MRHDVIMETDILCCIDTNTNWSEIVDDVVSKLNIIRVLDVDGPTEAVVDGTVCYSTVISSSLFESDGGLKGIDL